MNNIQELYKEKPELVEKLFEHLSEIKYKLKSESFQIINNEDELEIRKCSENKNEIGYLVGDYERLFSKSINESMNFVENNIERFEKYKFISFENINNSFFLNSVIDVNNNLVNINEVAKELNMEVLPNLLDENLSYNDFVKLITSSDIDNFINESVNKEDISGLVFSFNIDNKIAEYELSVSEININESVNRKDDSDFLSELYEFYNQWSEENTISESDNRLESIQKNFINMMSDYKVYSKLMNLGSKINLNESSIQADRCCNEVKKEIKKHGSIYKNLLEHYIVNESLKDFGTSFDYTIDPIIKHSDISDDKFSKLTLENYIRLILDMISERVSEDKKEKTMDIFNDSSNDNLISFIKTCYEAWDTIFKRDKNKIPFRFSQQRYIKIARCYGIVVNKDNWKSDSNGYYMKINVHYKNPKNGTESSKNIKFIYGNGLGGNSTNGMDFEHTLYEALKTWILSKYGKEWNDENFKTASGGDIAVYNILKKFDDENLFVKQVKTILKGIDIDENNINNYIQNPPPSNRPWASEVAKSDNFDTSGNKIADIIVTNKPVFKNINTNKVFDVNNLDLNHTIFISVKKENHQWTGSTISPDEYGSNWLKDMLEDKKDDNVIKTWKSFWKKIGIVDENQLSEILEAIKNRTNQEKSFDIKTNENDILEMAQNLLGTNYWVIQENKDIFFLKQELLNDKATLNSIKISKAKSNDSLSMKIITDKCTLSIRTTGKGLIVRMFPEFTENQFKSLIK